MRDGVTGRVFMALDDKTPLEWYKTEYATAIRREQMVLVGGGEYPDSSRAVGYNCVQRRNLATLAALDWGANVIITMDDDNLPIDQLWATRHYGYCNGVHTGIMADVPGGWWDPCVLLEPYPGGHRGMPLPIGYAGMGNIIPVVDEWVGVNAGLWLGDPDIDAFTRIGRTHPQTDTMTSLGDAGVVLSPATYAPFNSQNTSFVRALAPAMFMLPGVGRYDDIWASFIARRVMTATPYRVRYGGPLVFQSRNYHGALDDAEAELFGARHSSEFIKRLDAVQLEYSDPILANVVKVWHELSRADFVPLKTLQAADAWCKDIDRILNKEKP